MGIYRMTNTGCQLFFSGRVFTVVLDDYEAPSIKITASRIIRALRRKGYTVAPPAKKGE